MRAIPVASGATGVQAVTGVGTLIGFSCNVSVAGAAGTALYLRDGTSSAGAMLAIIPAGATGGMTEFLAATPFVTGLFVDKAAGTSELVLYVL